jgi:outer membrane biosynthesis protein TonB
MPSLQKKNGLKARPVPGRMPFSYSHPSQAARMEAPVRAERKAGREARVWPWVLATVVGIWMFGLGVVVGRHTVPVDMGEDITAELNRLGEEEARADRERMTEVSRDLATAPFEFYDALEAGDPGVPPPAPAAPETDAPAAPESPEAPDHPPEIKRVRVQKATPKPAAAPAPVETPPAAAKPSPAPAPGPPPAPAPARVSEGRFSVQVASFAVRADAERLAATLKKNDYAGVFIADEPGPDGTTRYRVKVGHFRTYADAKKVLDQLKSQERIHDAFVSRK